VTGWTWDYIGDHLDLPRLGALYEYWGDHPPLHVMAASYFGIKPKEKETTQEIADPAMALGAPTKALSPAQIIMRNMQRDSGNVE
jgi:hypothetical protein